MTYTPLYKKTLSYKTVLCYNMNRVFYFFKAVLCRGATNSGCHRGKIAFIDLNT